jgi:hypothetical protein
MTALHDTAKKKSIVTSLCAYFFNTPVYLLPITEPFYMSGQNMALAQCYCILLS